MLWFQAQFQDLEDLNLESDEFLSLPPEVRHEILTELKDNRKRTSWAKIDSLPSVCFTQIRMSVEDYMSCSHNCFKICVFVIFCILFCSVFR